MTTFIKRNGFVVLTLVLFLVMLLIYGATGAGHDRDLKDQEQQISSLGQAVSDAKTAADVQRQKADAKRLGVDNDRLALDKQIIDDLLNASLTWDDNKSYVAARETLLRKPGLDPKSQYMKTFLPKAPINKDKDGNEYPYIDAAGLNSRLNNQDVKVLSVSGTEYRYMVLATVESASKDSMGVASNTATIFLTIDGNEKITDLTGYAAKSKPRASGMVN